MTTTMYPSFRRTSDDGRAAAVEEDSDSCSEFSGHSNKVDCVCVSLRRALNDVGANKYLLSIITTYVKMTDPQLETVLEMIKQLKGTLLCMCMITIHYKLCGWLISTDGSYV